jgi:hypothetical protein
VTSRFYRIAATCAALVIVGLAVILLIRNQPIADARLFFVLRIVLSFSAAILGASIPGFLNVRWSGGGLVVRAGGALALFVLTYVYTPDLVKDQGPTHHIGLLGDCRQFSMPITVPAHDAIHLLPMNPRRVKTTGWGIYDITNDTSEQMQWPSKEMMAESQEKHNFGSFIYQCEISNIGTINLTNVGIRTRVWFGNAGGEETAVKYDVMVSPLNAGQSSRFYVVNDCEVIVNAVIPDTAIVKEIGMTKWEEVPLGRKFKNPIEQIIMLFPSTVRWLGGESCE